MKITLKLCIVLCIYLYTSVSFSQTPFFSQDFQTGFAIPTGWSQSQASGSTGWKFGYYTTIQSQYFTIPAHTKIAGTNDDKCNCDASMDYLMTPSIDLSSYTKVFLKFAYFFGEGTANQKKEEASIEISTDNGLTWNVIDMLSGVTVWTDYIIDISQYAGQSNVKIAFHYNDNGEYMYGFAIDDVKLYQPNQYDLSASSFTIDQYVGMGSVPINGSFYNNGSVTINSFNVNYQVDNNTVNTSTINGLNIPALGSYNFTHPINWVPTVAATYKIKMWSSDLNGNSDQNPANDTITKTITVVNSISQRIVLFEEFTQASCGPCAAQNPGLHTKLSANKGKIGVIKYQTSFPGVDPMYSHNPAVPDARQNYYGVSGVPTLFLDGVSVNGTAGYDGAPVNLTQSMIDNELKRVSLFNISVNETKNGSNVSLHIEITPHYSINVNDIIAHVVIVEDEINYITAPGTNGEKNFYWISRKMLPSASGTVIGPVDADVIETVDVNYTIDAMYNASRLSTVVFIQNNSTKEVYQSIMAKRGVTTPLEKMDENAIEITLSPNPLQSKTDLFFNLGKSEPINISVTNIMGQIVYTYSGKYSPGKHILNMDLSRYPDGIYNLQFKTSENVISKKLVVTR